MDDRHQDDDYRHADAWRPDRTRSSDDWLLEGLLREDHYGPYRFIRVYGTPHKPVPAPADLAPGKRGCCFANAFRLASVRPDLHYAEGYGTLWGSDTWLHRHAWCVDSQGWVIDPTWGMDSPLPLALRGLVLPLDLVEPYCRELSRGTLDDLSVELIAQRLGVRWPVGE
jgi:hypothetical protein